jgi:hypothetical protein
MVAYLSESPLPAVPSVPLSSLHFPSERLPPFLSYIVPAAQDDLPVNISTLVREYTCSLY